MATLIGDGGHARDIAATVGFDAFFAHHKRFMDDLPFYGAARPYVIGINDPHVRARVASEMQYDDLPWVHPNAVIGVECQWGKGTHINYGVTMTRTKLGKHCTISPGVTICGDVTIGDRVLVGAGAIICDRVTIGDDVTIGAGAIIRPALTIPPRTTWVGNPARQVTRLTDVS